MTARHDSNDDGQTLWRSFAALMAWKSSSTHPMGGKTILWKKLSRCCLLGLFKHQRKTVDTSSYFDIIPLLPNFITLSRT